MISLFRKSLTARAVLTTVFLGGISVAIIGSFLSYSLANSFYQNRLSQVLTETERAVDSVQTTIAASSLTDETALQTLLNSVVPSLEISGGSAPRQVALLRSPGQGQLQLFQSPISQNLDLQAIPDQLRQEVREAPGRLTYTPVSLSSDLTTVPGITVGTPIAIPIAGNFELYLVYNLSAEQRALELVQNALAIGGFFLLALIAAASFFVTRRLVAPVEEAAEAAREISEGKLDKRLPETGQDILATLASSFNKMATSLQTQIERLDALSRMQRRFVSDVSHELRTPMTTIKLAGEVLFSNRSKLEPSLSRSAELLQDQIERFDRLLSDLLEISRYDAGAIVPEFELHDVRSVAAAAIKSIEPLAKDRNTSLDLLAPQEPVRAEIDARRIERLLRNLLSNAIEHGGGKDVSVEIAENAQAVAICVTDRGVGMSRNELDRVFDRFWRADPARQRSVGGTGLGLAISKEDSALHRGWLQVWSKPKVGTSFRLTLPKSRDAVIANSPLPLPPRGLEA